MTLRLARWIWAALLAAPFVAAAAALVASRAPAPDLREPLFWVAVAAWALNVVLSRVLPPRLRPPVPGGPDAVAFTRLLVAFALCDAAALAPVVVLLVTGDARLLVLVAAGLFALALLYPSEPRWDRLRLEVSPAGSRRRVC